MSAAMKVLDRMIAMGVFSAYPRPVGSIAGLLSQSDREALAGLKSEDLLALRFQSYWANKGDEHRDLMLRCMR